MDPTTRTLPLRIEENQQAIVPIESNRKDTSSSRQKLKNIARILEEEHLSEYPQEEWPQHFAFRGQMVTNALNIQAGWEAKFVHFSKINKLRVKLTGERKAIKKLVEKIRRCEETNMPLGNLATRVQQIIDRPNCDAFKVLIEQNAIHRNLEINRDVPLTRRIINRLIELKDSSEKEKEEAFSADLHRMFALLLQQEEITAEYSIEYNPQIKTCLYLAIEYGLVECTKVLLDNWDDTFPHFSYPSDHYYNKILVEVWKGQDRHRMIATRNYYPVLFSLCSIVESNESPESLKILEILIKDIYDYQAGQIYEFQDWLHEIFDYLIRRGKKQAIELTFESVPQEDCLSHIYMVSLASKVLQQEQVSYGIFEILIEKLILCENGNPKKRMGAEIDGGRRRILISAVYYTKCYLDLHPRPTLEQQNKINTLLECIQLIAQSDDVELDTLLRYHKIDPFTERWNQVELNFKRWEQWNEEQVMDTVMDVADENQIIRQALLRVPTKSAQKLIS